MAMSMSVVDTNIRPRWPSEPFDNAGAFLHFGEVADELLLFFSPEPVPSVSDPLVESPDGGETAVLIGLGPDDEETGEVVGIHVYPLLAGPAQAHPAWRGLTEPDPDPEVVARFVTEVRELFDRYWTPAPPIAEQLAGSVAGERDGGG